MINILSLFAISYNTNYYVENIIEFQNLDPRANYVSLLNTIDSSIEHSKALYYNFSKVLDTTIPSSNNWEIPYSVNYIPSLGTDFNLIFTENYIENDYFKETDINGYYNLSPEFTITSDKQIDITYNNETIFQPGNIQNFTLIDFKNTVLVELLSKTDNEWIAYPSMQRFILEQQAYNVTDSFIYDYYVPISVQNYFRIDFKLRFTELHNDRRTNYIVETYNFNVPGLVISDFDLNHQFIDLTIDWAHIDGDIIIDITNNGTIVQSFDQLISNPIQITNNYTSGNYTLKICDKNNRLVCNQIELEITEGNNTLIDPENDVHTDNPEDTPWENIIAISLGVVLGTICVIIFAYYISFQYFGDNKVYPNTHRPIIGYNNHIYENPSIYGEFNRDINGNSLPPLREDRPVNHYNKLDRNNVRHQKAIVNGVYHIAVDY
jgi:hypothetical protein